MCNCSFMSICHWPTSFTLCLPQHVPISSLPSSVNSFTPLLPSHLLILRITVLFPFLDHFPQIPVPTFTLSIAFPFTFPPLPVSGSRHSILMLLKAGSWFLFQPGKGWLWGNPSVSSNRTCRAPSLSIFRCPQVRGVSGLPLAQVLPRQSPPSALALGSLALARSLQTLLLRSFSWLLTPFHTFCCLALLSSTCSVSQLLLHHLQLSSLCSSASFSHMGSAPAIISMLSLAFWGV